MKAFYRRNRTACETVFLLIVILAMMWAAALQADDVKYCENLETGEIRVVRADMTCPFPMAEI